MLSLNLKNMKTMVLALATQLTKDSKNEQFAESMATFTEYTLNSEREKIGGLILNLRDELDRLERYMDEDYPLFGGTRFTTRAAELDEALSQHYGRAKMLEEMTAMLEDKPEMA